MPPTPDEIENQEEPIPEGRVGGSFFDEIKNQEESMGEYRLGGSFLGTKFTPKIPYTTEEREERERLESIREITNNPHYKLTKEEAMSYAAEAGMSDSMRGITQLAFKTVGYEKGLENLKKYDTRLHGILQNPEYGNQGLATFIGTAIAADPVNFIPVANILAKANTARKLIKFSGAATSTILRKTSPVTTTQRIGQGAFMAGAFSGLGYVNEEAPGIVGETQSRLENILIGGAVGGTLGLAVGSFSRARNKRNPMRKTDVISIEGFDPTKLDADEIKYLTNWKSSEAVLPAGQRVSTADSSIIGRILRYDNETKNYVVEQVVDVSTGKVNFLNIPEEQILGWSGKSPKSPRAISKAIYEDMVWTEKASQLEMKDNQIVYREKRFRSNYNLHDSDSGTTFRVQELYNDSIPYQRIEELEEILLNWNSLDRKTINSLLDEPDLLQKVSDGYRWGATGKIFKTKDEALAVGDEFKKYLLENELITLRDTNAQWQILKMKDEKEVGELFNSSLSSSTRRTGKVPEDFIDDFVDNQNIRFSSLEDAKKAAEEALLRDRNQRAKLTTNLDRPDILTETASVAEEASKKGKNVATAVDDNFNKRIKDIILEENASGWKISDSVQEFYQSIAGDKLADFVLKTHWGSSLVGATAGVAAWNSEHILGHNALTDPEATPIQKAFTSALWIIGGVALTKGLGGIKVNGNTYLRDIAGKGLLDNYGIDPVLIKLNRQRGVDTRTIMSTFVDILEKPDYAKLSNEEFALAHSFMTGRLDVVNKLSVEGQALSNEARQTLTKYTQELVDLGLLHEDTWKKNINQWLKRSYAQYVGGKNKSWFSSIQGLSFDASELRPRGKQIKDVSFSSFNNRWQKEGYEIMVDNRTSIEKSNGSGEVKIRLDYTPEELSEMGVMDDAAYAIAESGRLLAHDVGVGRFFKSIAEAKDEAGNSLWTLTKAQWEDSSDEVRALFKEVPRTKVKDTEVFRYGELARNKLFIKPEVLDYLTKTLNLRSDESLSLLKRIYSKTMGLWKIDNTAWNPAVHTNNVTSNVVNMTVSNTPMKYLYRSVKEYRNKKNSEIIKLAEKYGVTDANIIRQELHTKFIGEIEEKLASIRDDADLPNILNYTNRVGNFIKDNAKRFNPFAAMTRLYQWEDHVFRVAVFMDRIDKAGGLKKASPDALLEAADDARKSFVDYEINAPLIEMLRNGPVPFISYTYRMIPRIAETAIKRPHVFALMAVLNQTINDTRRYIEQTDTSPEELERLGLRENYSQRMWGVPFMAPTLVRLPLNSKAGDSQYIDISRMIPGGDIFNQSDKSQGGLPGVPSAFQPSFGIVGDLYNSFTARVDPFTGMEVSNLQTDSLASIKDFIRKQIPNNPIVPGSYSQNRIRTALELQRGYDFETREEPYNQDPSVQVTKRYVPSTFQPQSSPLEAVLYGLGIKLRPQNPYVTGRIRRAEHDRVISEWQSRHNTNENNRTDQNPPLSQENYEAEEQRISLGRMIEESEYQKYLQDVYRLRVLANPLEEENGIFTRPEPTGGLLMQALRRREARENKELRETNVTGGLIKGEDVPFAKEDPATRRNPLTGEPYVEEGLLEVLKRRQEDRTLMNKGGLLSTLKKRRQSYKDGDKVKGGDPVSTDRDKSMQGFLGPIKNNVTGKIMTEVSIGVEIDGKEILIPAMVPTLTPKEIDTLKNINIGEEPLPESIIDKATRHAIPRINKNMNPFYQDRENEQQ